ncbi:MAG: hydrolase [Halieaceae bacterium MED-G26]|nr:MAG: hydrolase [Halieaceae bacterium MED-G26]
MRPPKIIVALLLLSVTFQIHAETVVYTAKLIRTMEPALPEATAVAVEDGKILAVGSLENLSSLIATRGAQIDRQFEDSVITPGFIDPHVHPTLPAVLTQFPFLAPDDWYLPTGDFPSATTPEGYRSALQNLVYKHDDASVPFVAFGYHPLWHGEVWREDLNDWFGDTPVMIWHRSFHELIGNDAAWNLLGVTQDDADAIHEGANWERGHFYELGLRAVFPRMGFLFEPKRYMAGMQNFLAMMHESGVTTAADMGTGIFGNPVGEIQAVKAAVASDPVGVRILLTPIITDFMTRGKNADEALAEVRRWQGMNDEHVSVGNHFKLMIDGAIFSGLSQMGSPGYLDGHTGVWMVDVPTLEAFAKTFWDAGFQIHAHSNGDAATARFIDLLDYLLRESPRADHRMTLEHFAYSTEDQNRKLAALGAAVSANPYYHYILSEMYSGDWLGPDRGPQMVRLGSLESKGVPVGLHSDSPMAPLSPLTLMWTAVARENISGDKTGQGEVMSRYGALKAITIDAAWILGLEDSIGSIRAGKAADFTVLSADPMTVPLKTLRSIDVIGTVFAGTAHRNQ